MRELKFRAWDGREMLNNVGTLPKHNPGELTMLGRHRERPVVWAFRVDSDQVKLMQYTGLKDKNGKEIYESDLIRLPDGWVGEVVWCQEWSGAWEYGYYLKQGTNPTVSIKFPQTQNDFEVVGNKYEKS